MAADGDPRRRAIGMTMGALAAIERNDEVEAERLLERAKVAYDGRDWSYFLQMTLAAEAVSRGTRVAPPTAWRPCARRRRG